MNSFVLSQIRTYVPIAVGALLTWLASSLDIVIDPSSQAGLVAIVVAVLSAAYYGLVRLIERKIPQASILLGSPPGAQPLYHPAKLTPMDPGQPAAGIPPPAP